MSAIRHRIIQRGAVVLVAIGLLVASWSVNAAAEDPASIAKRVKEIKKTLSDPLAGEAEHRTARKQLQALVARTSPLIGGLPEDHPLQDAHFSAQSLLNEVDARLPSEDPEAPGAVGFPVPQFEDGKLLSRLAKQVKSAQHGLAKALREHPKDKKLLNALLIDLVLAEENLAWEAGWPFTEEEAEDYKDSGDTISPKIYLSRRERGIKVINDQLAKEAGTTGRGESQRPYVIHAPVDKESRQAVAEALDMLRGSGATDWHDGTKPFDAKERQALFGGKPASTR
jgi:hypothetical protein